MMTMMTMMTITEIERMISRETYYYLYYLLLLFLLDFRVIAQIQEDQKEQQSPTINQEVNALSRGWGDSIKWLTLEDAIERSKVSNKPIMVIIHKTWCGSCKRLKPVFSQSEEIRKLSAEFEMVNLQDKGCIVCS